MSISCFVTLPKPTDRWGLVCSCCDPPLYFSTRAMDNIFPRFASVCLFLSAQETLSLRNCVRWLVLACKLNDLVQDFCKSTGFWNICFMYSNHAFGFIPYKSCYTVIQKSDPLPEAINNQYLWYECVSSGSHSELCWWGNPKTHVCLSAGQHPHHGSTLT